MIFTHVPLKCKIQRIKIFNTIESLQYIWNFEIYILKNVILKAVGILAFAIYHH